MSANLGPPGYRWFQFFRNAPIRVGIYTGVWLSAVLTVWVLVANRAPFLEPLAQQRNVSATLLLVVIAAMPVIRFLRSPADLLLSGLLAWGLMTLTYHVLGFFFVLLEEYYTAVHVFAVGAVAYLLFATFSWVGMIIWRARTREHTHTPR